MSLLNNTSSFSLKLAMYIKTYHYTHPKRNSLPPPEDSSLDEISKID
jgi:hypothetical protein